MATPTLMASSSLLFELSVVASVLLARAESLVSLPDCIRYQRASLREFPEAKWTKRSAPAGRSPSLSAQGTV
jgi:hypothetical protein